MTYIIIKGKTKFGKTRSEQEQNLRKEGMMSMSDEKLDHCKYMERKIRDYYGAKESFVSQKDLRGEPLKTKTDE